MIKSILSMKAIRYGHNRFAVARMVFLLAAQVMLMPVSYSQVTADTTARRLIKESRFDEALGLIDAELKKKPRDATMWLLKGAALSMSDRKDESIRVFKEMIAEKMEIASAYNNIAVIHSERGEFESARLALEAAMRIKPDYSVALHNLGNVYSNLAGLAYKRALQLDQADKTLPTKLSHLSQILGKTFDKPVDYPVAPKVNPEPEQRIPGNNKPTQVTLQWQNSTPPLTIAAKGNNLPMSAK